MTACAWCRPTTAHRCPSLTASAVRLVSLGSCLCLSGEECTFCTRAPSCCSIGLPLALQSGDPLDQGRLVEWLCAPVIRRPYHCLLPSLLLCGAQALYAQGSCKCLPVHQHWIYDMPHGSLIFAADFLCVRFPAATLWEPGGYQPDGPTHEVRTGSQIGICQPYEFNRSY